MAVTNDGPQRTFKAGADLSASSNRNKAVKQDSNGDIVLATAATDKTIGVLQETAKDNGNAIVRLNSWTSKATAGGTVTPGAYLTPTTGGKLIATTTAGQRIVGIALIRENAADGDTIEFMNMTGFHPA